MRVGGSRSEWSSVGPGKEVGRKATNKQQAGGVFILENLGRRNVVSVRTGQEDGQQPIRSKRVWYSY